MQAESEATGVWCTFICMCESGASLLCDAYARLLGSLQKPTTLFKLNAAFEDLFSAPRRSLWSVLYDGGGSFKEIEV